MANDIFYNSEKWRRKREHILRRDGYKDQLELRAGRTVPAEMVHHILPREQYPQYTFSDWNLISISRATHRELHTPLGNLTPAGEKLKRETAHINNIPLCERILIVGMPGSGKTTLAKQIIRDGLCYDLDYISAAFRLKQPGKENHIGARKMANALFKAWAINAEKYSGRVILIRTAPTIEELETIEPTKIYELGKIYDPKKLKGINVSELDERLRNGRDWARACGVEWQTLTENDNQNETGSAIND